MTPGPRPAGRAYAAAVAVCAAMIVLSLVVPSIRTALVVTAVCTAPVVVAFGVLRHRPRPRTPWLALLAMLACWSVAVTQVQLTGANTASTWVLMTVGEVPAILAVVRLMVVGRPSRAEREPGEHRELNVLVLVVVLALVVAHFVTVGRSTGGLGVRLAAGPALDVLVLGLMVRFTVERRLPELASRLVVAGSLEAVAYDLLCGVQGLRVSLPGSVLGVLGVSCCSLFALAALHPSMTAVFDPPTAAHRRRPSASLLGLLPLAVVPAGLWWLATATHVAGLPTWVFLAVEAAVAGLCLLRAAAVLRRSEHLAEHDPLTDLANRRGLARLHAAGAPGPERSMLLVDVDEFKQVNDTHGHDVGDALLLEVRDRLLAAAGPAGRVARLGGDEFVLLVPGSDGGRVADELLTRLRRPVRLGDLELRTSASVGLAAEEPGLPLSELLTRADVAMYAAKSAGRDRVVVFRPDLRTEVVRRFTLTGQVRALLGGEDARVGHLEVHYQPLVDLATARTVGAEALVRWRHPEHGLMAPDAFLGLVNASGLDAQLDSAVLREVLDQLGRWRDQGRSVLPISVNLTRASLLDPELVDRVLGALAEADVPPALLHLEITEHEQLPDDPALDRRLRRLDSAGVRLHLDDYGTGYTSLDYLRRFPIEVLKLDRAVTASMGEGEVEVVAGIAAMARTMSLQVLAEGVETERQRACLAALGVELGQGWLFSRPMPAGEYADAALGARRAPPPCPGRDADAVTGRGVVHRPPCTAVAQGVGMPPVTDRVAPVT